MNKELFDRFINGEIGINTQTKQEYLELIEYLDNNVGVKLLSSASLFSIKLAHDYHAGSTCLRVKEGKYLLYDSKDYYIANEPDLKIINYSDLISSKMTVEELRDLMLENFVDEYGNLCMTGLDFSEFDGDVDIDEMVVKGNLIQCRHRVGGHLYQGNHKVGKNLYQSHQEVGGNLHQGHNEVGIYYECTDVNYGVACCFDEPKKILEELTVEELAKLGYKLKEGDK